MAKSIKSFTIPGVISAKQIFDTREFVKIMAAEKVQGTQSKRQCLLAQIAKWFRQTLKLRVRVRKMQNIDCEKIGLIGTL